MTEENISKSNAIDTNSATQKEKVSKTILTSQEVESVVRSFILSWLRGTIEIHFPTSKEMEENVSKRMPGTLTLYPVGYDGKQDAANVRAEFVTLVQICTGAKPATVQEQEKALQKLFERLLAYRTTLRIKGTFTPFDVEKQLDEMQAKVDATNKVVNEIVTFLRREAEGQAK
jgi:hypothetical protein